MNYWIVKSEPESYSWDDFVAKGEDTWDGVRNYQARNFLKTMKKGDLVFFYHSGKSKELVGLAEVSETAFPDPTDKDWEAVKLKVCHKLKKPVSLSQIKSDERLADLLMVRQSRLSVSPVKKGEYEQLMVLSS